MAAERAGVRSVAMVHTVYPLPRPGVPPFGLGLKPAGGLAGRLRDGTLERAFRRAFAPGLRASNAARVEIGLAPHAGPFDQVTSADRILVLTSPAFDFAGRAPLPDNVRYTGPIVPGDWATSWEPPWP